MITRCVCVYLPQIGSKNSNFIINGGDLEWKSFPEQDVLFCPRSDPVHQNVSSSPFLTINLLQYSDNVLSKIIIP